MGKLKWSALKHSLKIRIRSGVREQLLRRREKGIAEINCCSIHDIYQKFYYDSLKLLLIPKTGSKGNMSIVNQTERDHIFLPLNEPVQ